MSPTLRAVVFLLGLGYLAVAPPVMTAPQATWAPTGSMAADRAFHTASLLSDGRVLVVGGESPAGYLSSAEVYDAATGTWSSTGSMAEARTFFASTLLADGRVLVAGGQGLSGYLSSAELFDPVTGTWSTAPSMSQARWAPTATLLTDGRVLVAGGSDDVGVFSSAELFDPASGTWSPTGSMADARAAHTATLLPDGRVLVATGQHAGAPGSTELYDPVTGTWSATGSMTTDRLYHTATLLPDGRVLAAGGQSAVALDSAEVYDPVTGVWSTVGSMAQARLFHTTTVLPNGLAMIVGGADGATQEYFSTAEFFDPETGTWSTAPEMGVSRVLHTATRLPSGQLLIAGGGNDVTFHSSAEMYDDGVVADAGVDQVVTTDATGQATVTLSGIGSGGTAPFTYAWSTPTGTFFTQTVVVTLEPGVHSVTLTATDADGVSGSDTMRVTARLPCAAGSYFASPSDLLCTPAPPGTFASGNDATEATACAPGTAQPEAGQASCSSCPMGFFSSSFGATSCTPATVCGPGTTQTTPSTAMSDAVCSADSDGDGVINDLDPDDDNDGILDADDAFPFDAAESVDSDGDGVGNNADLDDDHDGIADAADAFPLNAAESVDTDGDGVGNIADLDDDNDGVADATDALPLDPDESVDTDGDGVGNNADLDDDNDGAADAADAFPLDAAESVDTDGDGVGNNADLDDDHDGVADATDALPLNASESLDSDGDGVGNNADLDDDNDGVADAADAFPLDAGESLDTDGDGVGNNADLDDDNDGIADFAEVWHRTNPLMADSDGDGFNDQQEAICATNPRSVDSRPDADNDGDGLVDCLDPDDDSDGIEDGLDADIDGDLIANDLDRGPTSQLDTRFTGAVAYGAEMCTAWQYGFTLTGQRWAEGGWQAVGYWSYKCSRWEHRTTVVSGEITQGAGRVDGAGTKLLSMTTVATGITSPWFNAAYITNVRTNATDNLLRIMACGKYVVETDGAYASTYSFYCGSLHVTALQGEVRVPLGDGGTTVVTVSGGAALVVDQTSSGNGMSTYSVSNPSDVGTIRVTTPTGTEVLAAGQTVFAIVPSAPDADNDGVRDDLDNCATVANPDQADMDDDRAGDVCDVDVDGNGVDDAASGDDDGDGVPDAIDSCQFTPNADQADVDQDGTGDACDGDVGNDGLADGLQALCSADGVTGPVPDGDGDGIPDCVDQDLDNDGLSNQEETALGLDPLNADADGDGVPDGMDPFPTDADQSFDVEAPVLIGMPASFTTEAAGVTTLVSYLPPTAVDAVAGPTPVTCSPASGSPLGLGAHVVTCSTADHSGNTSSASFTVTVVDTTPPVITETPTSFSLDATSAATPVTYALPAASDLVDGVVAAGCTPASGSPFPVGPTTVTCAAADAHGNTAGTTFTVQVDDVTTPGDMHGEGFIRSGADKYAFRFDVRERASGSERGRLSLTVDYGKQPVVDKKGRTRFEKPKDARFRATAITFVAFSDDPTIRPGRSRKVQIDTVRFSGLGEWNGQAGYVFEVVASDQGEPGRHRESIAIVIRDATGLVVAQVSGDLDGGNVQSKRIQH